MRKMEAQTREEAAENVMSSRAAVNRVEEMPPVSVEEKDRRVAKKENHNPIIKEIWESREAQINAISELKESQSKEMDGLRQRIEDLEKQRLPRIDGELTTCFVD